MADTRPGDESYPYELMAEMNATIYTWRRFLESNAPEYIAWWDSTEDGGPRVSPGGLRFAPGGALCKRSPRQPEGQAWTGAICACDAFEWLNCRSGTPEAAKPLTPESASASERVPAGGGTDG